MGDLLLILLCLFVGLGVLVTVAERYAKPMDAQQQSKLSRILIILVSLLLVSRLLQHWLEG